ncbi:hypothetical protein RI129_003127 [Pyrocoelia pectoralis]|uniref:StAR-related lipid transfer protein 3 n=1 Tax=Pyrocoelia pectoralis TaxID=417401 RepID=A0AAN7VGG0_9COLE
MPSHTDTRLAAETLLRSNSLQSVPLQDPDITRNYSINANPSMPTEYVTQQELLRSQQGSMSKVRRFFCLFVTFDLAFSGLMWLICIMINGDNISNAIDKEIYHYTIHTSLFDIVLVAVLRFLMLLLFYGLCSINHWIIIALSTTATSVFLIAKVFQYSWVQSHQPVFEVLFILTSFVISWGEAWFLDFRVLPQEFSLTRVLINTPDNERAPLIRSYVQGLPSMYTESVGNFYSPLATPEGSVCEVDRPERKYPQLPLSIQKENEYRGKGVKILQESWRLLTNSDWKLEKRNAENDVVHVLSVPNTGKIFKVSATLNASPQFLLEELFYKVETIPQWNPALLESHKIQSIDEHTDICYQISADTAGVVTSRDFVNIRHWGVVEGCYVIGYSAAEHPSVVRSEKYVRGENGVGCWAMKPVPGEIGKCNFEWVLNTNLKGWIPQYILDTALVGVLLDYVKNLRKHLMKLNESK